MKNYQYIEQAANKQPFDKVPKGMENFYTWEEAQEFLIEIGKRARAIVAEDGSFINKMMMKEIEECYYKALHADCAYPMHVSCEAALVWYSKMVRRAL